jgi:hypothetical protein
LTLYSDRQAARLKRPRSAVAARTGAVHALYAERGARDGPLANVTANGQPQSWALRGPDPLQLAFDAALAASLAWLKAIRHVQADDRTMRRLEFVTGLGRMAVTLIAIASLLLGVMALGSSLALLAITLILACAVTAVVRSGSGRLVPFESEP